jgi:ATP/maltotriose-dependent transcriptional regulator MalT
VEQPLVLVLDDAHHLREPAITADLGTVIEQLPRGSKIMFTSRVEPHMPIARWRGRSWLIELHQRDLALTLSETVALVTALGEDRLSASEIETLWQHTEGWVAGLRLALTALRDRADVSAAVAEFSGRHPIVAELLAEELLYHAPGDLTDFLLRTSVVDVLDAELCDALSGRNDSGEVLRKMEAELQFVVGTGPAYDSYRYHPLLAEMLGAELKRRYPAEVSGLNQAAAAIFASRGDTRGAVRCLLAAGDVDRAFSMVFVAAYARHDRADLAGVVAFVNLFPLELVSGSAFRMLTYGLMLGMCNRADDAISWIQRAATRIAAEPDPDLKDVAALDAIRLVGFTTTTGFGDQLAAGRRALEAVEAGVDLGILSFRVRMNLVRGHLLVDAPGEADVVLHSGSPGDEIAALLLAPALAARIALRQGNLTEAAHQSSTALAAAHAFGLDTHFGAIDALLARLGVLVDRNELAGAARAIAELEEILQRYPQAIPFHVLLRLEEVRVAAARGEFGEAFSTIDGLRKLVGDRPRTALLLLIDAVAARWYVELGEPDHAAKLIASVSRHTPDASAPPRTA